MNKIEEAYVVSSFVLKGDGSVLHLAAVDSDTGDPIIRISHIQEVVKERAKLCIKPGEEDIIGTFGVDEKGREIFVPN